MQSPKISRSEFAAGTAAERDEQELDLLIDELTETIDEFYTQYLCEAPARKQTIRQMLQERLASLLNQQVAATPQHGEAKHHVEMIALETQLQEARAHLQQMEKKLEEKAKQLEAAVAENMALRRQEAELRFQHKKDVAAIEHWQAQFTAIAAEPRTPAADQKMKASAEDASPFHDPEFLAAARWFAQLHAGRAGATASPQQLAAVFKRAAQTLDVLLQAMRKLMEARLRFRVQYFDESGERDGVAWILQKARSADELKELLLASDLSGPEFTKNLKTLGDELVLLYHHQWGLLQGYRACIVEGVRQVLLVLHPHKLLQEFGKKNTKLGTLQLPKPVTQFLSHWQFLAYYQRRHDNLLKEDPSYFDKLFSPGFRRRYKTCMASALARKIPRI